MVSGGGPCGTQFLCSSLNQFKIFTEHHNINRIYLYFGSSLRLKFFYNGLTSNLVRWLDPLYSSEDVRHVSHICNIFVDRYMTLCAY